MVRQLRNTPICWYIIFAGMEWTPRLVPIYEVYHSMFPLPISTVVGTSSLCWVSTTREKTIFNLIFVRVVSLSEIIIADSEFITKVLFHFTPILVDSICKCGFPFYGYKCKFSFCDQNLFWVYPHFTYSLFGDSILVRLSDF